MTERPDVVIIMTDEERAVPPYEADDVLAWRDQILTGRKWFDDNGVSFTRHYTGSLACTPSRPTLFTGHYPDVHGVTQTDGLGKLADDSLMRWLREREVPTLGNWFQAAGYDTHYAGKWHISHADLPAPGGDGSLATNDDAGLVDHNAVQAYVAANRLEAFGFSGWIGPEPHGAALANSGLRRDPLIADRVVTWLAQRYERRRAGDADARRPFLLVASFVNPHDIVLFPAWRRRSPIGPSPLDPPHVPPAPTADEDLSTKPASQIAFREAYYTGYGPAPAVKRIYETAAQEYRDLYYRLHAEVDAPLDRVRRAVTDGGSDNAVLVRTADHGDLLGAHGGLHQKWFNLYDEATRVPFVIARIGPRATAPRVIEAPTSHVDLVPTLLSAAGIDVEPTATELSRSFSELHQLPGRDLMDVVDGADADGSRAVYMMTRDNILEGDSSLSALARRLGRTNPPPPLRIAVPANVAANFEGLVVRVEDADTPGGRGHVYKIVRSFDDPLTWTEPGVRHHAADAPGGSTYRTIALPDQWELYDLSADPIESNNRWNDPQLSDLRNYLEAALKRARAESVPERNEPWPYVSRSPVPPVKTPPRAVRVLRKALQRLGMHPEDRDADSTLEIPGGRALVIATNHAVLDVGKPTGVFASEMTAPYYVFSDAGMTVDVASPAGGAIPVDPMSLRPVLRSSYDDRFLVDDTLRSKVNNSHAVGDLDMADYDVVYLAGGWGAAFDFGTSEALALKLTEANTLGLAIGGVCHGPLGLRNAKTPDGAPLVEGRRISAVTNKQVHELGIESTPQHPETEMRRMGARFESQKRFRDPLANHWVVDGNLVTGQNQNAAPMVARELIKLVAESRRTAGTGQAAVRQ